MKIITNKGSIDTNKDAVVIVFNDDDELNSFMARIAATPVKTSSVRILSLIPDGMGLSPLQTALLDVINGMDGIGCNNNDKHEKIVDETVDKLNDIINS